MDHPGPTSSRFLGSRADAEKLADQINNYWHLRSYYGIRVQVVQSDYKTNKDHNGTLWTICSNIGPQGYPPRHPEGAYAL